MARDKLTLERVVAEADQLSPEDRLRLIHHLAQTLLPAETEGEIPNSLLGRRAFLKLPLAERQRLLRKQAAAAEDYYRNDNEWREFGIGDFVDY
jgi:hypothetical protein